jgi:hypothetical protein
VYIAGYDYIDGNTIPCYWINGVQHNLPFTGEKGYVKAIATSGSNVYIGGFDFKDGYNGIPSYWINDAQHNLPFTGRSSVGAITVSGSNVYIVGFDGNTPCYWINGVQKLLPFTGRGGVAEAIALR